MNQILFPVGLYLLGVLFGISLKRNIPLVFSCLTGFLWGSLIWSATSIILLILNLYTLINVSIALLLVLLLLIVIIGRNKIYRFDFHEFCYLFVGLATFTIAVMFGKYFNYTAVTYDSIAQIMLGRTLGYDGLNDFTKEILASWGILIPSLQAASVLLNVDYMSTIHPAYFYTFFTTYAYLCYRMITRSGLDMRHATMIVSLIIFFLLTTYFFIFQSYYIHNNFPAMTYLSVAIAAFWLGQYEHKWGWLIFAAISLCGFSICRTESPLFALIFLAIFLSSDNYSYREKFLTSMPYLFVILMWYIILFKFVGTGSDIMNPQRLLLIVMLNSLLALFVCLSYFKTVNKYIAAYLHMIMLGAVCTLILGFLIFYPLHILKSLSSIFLNMLVAGRWCVLWFFILPLINIPFHKEKYNFERIFSFGIISFFLLLLSFSVARQPYQIGWGDSANRIIMHIVPICLYYIILNYSHRYCRRNTGASN